jgi:Ethanolamine utilization protein EutJ (predicted chaperonin)
MVARFVVFADLTDGELLDADVAVEMMEALGSDLEALEKGFLRELIDAFAAIAEEYSGEAQRVVRDIAHSFYLEEAIAADDPVRLAQLEALRDARE